MLCYLNRKPYRDAEGNVRTRKQCCGKRTSCTLSVQPQGQIVKSGGPKRKKRINKNAAVVVERPKKGKKK